MDLKMKEYGNNRTIKAPSKRSCCPAVDVATRGIDRERRQVNR